MRAYKAKRRRVETESDAAAAPPVSQSVRRRWGAEEETELRELVEEHRPESSEDWRQLAELHGNGRSVAAVKNKWKDLTASASNAQAQAIVAESQGTSKRPHADAEPRRRARKSTSATVGHARPCEIRKVGESIWRRFASVRTAAESLALYFPDLISSTVTLYLYHLLANNPSCPYYIREAFEARYVDATDAAPAPIAAPVVSTPPSPRESPLAESPMTDIEEAVAPPPCEWPVTGAAVSTPDRATVSPPRESPTRAESELLPVGELVLADRSGTGDDWA